MGKPKIIIWGHKLASHTHSSVHRGFYRAFEHLGYDTYWLDDNDDVSNFDFSDCIFLTEGNVCGKMPRRKDCKYILHNCPPMEGIGKSINIQYLTKQYADKGEEMSHGIRLISGDCLMFAWGSDLLPNEFDETLLGRPRNKDIWYIGTVDNKDVKGGNYEPVTGFAKIAKNNGLSFKYGGGYSVDFRLSYMEYMPGWISDEDQKELLSNCYAMPALQGERQLVNMMIPCRLFKAIQYGLDGISNNEFAYEFFNRQITYNENISDLFYCSELLREEKGRRKYLFNFVKQYHTYLNNVNAIMKVL